MQAFSFVKVQSERNLQSNNSKKKVLFPHNYFSILLSLICFSVRFA